MKKFVLFLPWLFFACQENDMPEVYEPAPLGDTVELPAAVDSVRPPRGVYSGVFPGGVNHTLQFFPDGSFRHEQKKISGERTSKAVFGSWSLASGRLFLTQDDRRGFHAVFGADGDTLYGVLINGIKPKDSSKYSLERQMLAGENEHWKKEFATGVSFVALGNEPFWNLQIRGKEATLKMAAQEKSIRLGAVTKEEKNDSLTYTFANDSAVVLQVFPQFCSDGMSDFVYEHKVILKYRHDYYRGCGISAVKEAGKK